MQIAVETFLMSAEGEYPHRHGDTDVDANLAAVGPIGEFARIITALRVNHRTVGELVAVHDGEPLFEILDALYTEDGAEYLFVSDRHPRRYVIEDGGAEVKTVLISGDHDVSAVKHKRRAFFNAFIYPAGDTGLMRGVHQRTEVRRFIVGGANL